MSGTGLSRAGPSTPLNTALREQCMYPRARAVGLSLRKIQIREEGGGGLSHQKAGGGGGEGERDLTWSVSKRIADSIL